VIILGTLSSNLNPMLLTYGAAVVAGFSGVAGLLTTGKRAHPHENQCLVAIAVAIAILVTNFQLVNLHDRAVLAASRAEVAAWGILFWVVLVYTGIAVSNRQWKLAAVASFVLSATATALTDTLCYTQFNLTAASILLLIGWVLSAITGVVVSWLLVTGASRMWRRTFPVEH